MDTNQLAVLAGSISTMIFAASNIPMLLKVLRTKEVGSYSVTNIALANVGNLIYWVYLATLPFGPVWLLHGYNTITTALMLALYLRFSHKPQTKKHTIRGRNAAIFQTQEIPAV